MEFCPRRPCSGTRHPQMVSGACNWITGYCFMEKILYILPAAPIVSPNLVLHDSANCDVKYSILVVVVMKLSTYHFESDLNQQSHNWIQLVWANWMGYCCFTPSTYSVFMIYIMIRTCVRGPGLTHWQVSNNCYWSKLGKTVLNWFSEVEIYDNFPAAIWELWNKHHLHATALVMSASSSSTCRARTGTRWECIIRESRQSLQYLAKLMYVHNCTVKSKTVSRGVLVDNGNMWLIYRICLLLFLVQHAFSFAPFACLQDLTWTMW